MIIAIIGFFVGVLCWTGCGLYDETLCSYGAILAMASLCVLIVYGLCANSRSCRHPFAAIVFSALSGLLLFAGIFSLFCVYELIPIMPNTEEAKSIYWGLALPLLLTGGGTTAARFIIIIL